MEHEPRQHSPEHQPEPGYEPRVWVGCLTAYNAGTLHGRWIEATQDPAAIDAEIQEILSTSPAAGVPEQAVFDHDDFASMAIGEYEDSATISRKARLIQQHGEAFARFYYMCGADLDRAEREFHEAYLGHFDDIDDVAMAVVNKLDVPRQFRWLAGQMPQWSRKYILFRSMALMDDLMAEQKLLIMETEYGFFAYTNNLWKTESE